MNTIRIRTFPGNEHYLCGSARGSGGNNGLDHDEDVMEMNEVRRCASGRVQPAPANLPSMIDGPGHPTGHLVIPDAGDDPC